MGKASSEFICQQCSYQSPRWFGKCPECGSWNTAVETVVSTTQSAKNKRQRGGARTTNDIQPIFLSSITTRSTARMTTNISELDRVLGGGLVPGQVVLIAGEPGIGKSTLLLQVANELGNKQSLISDAGRQQVLGNSRKDNNKKSNDYSLVPNASVLYVCGEESPNQIKIRADRLGVKRNGIQLLETTDIDQVIDTVNGGQWTVDSEKTKNTIHNTPNTKHSLFIIVDSIQTMATSDLSGMAGSVGQVRECTYRLVRFAKENNIPMFIVGHVTKEGTVAGPSVLMHIVDTVLWFEGDKSQSFRFLRAVKNRFGATDEVGIFSMEDRGLTSLDNPEKLFLADTKENLPGTTIASVLQGSRPLLIEIQSLIVPTKLAIPRRVAQGIDPRRFELLLAVLTRRAGLPLYDSDCFVNIAGGISIKGDPSADLAICLAVASAFLDKPLPKGTVAIGEVGLLGDIRPVVAQEKRIKEARRLGYKNVITNREANYLRETLKKFLGTRH